MRSETPIVFLAFNRPDLAARVLERIRAARPRRMTVVCDGPRPDHPNDRRDVARTRRLIESAIDWPCELVRDYASVNLGCGPRVASGLNAAFERYDRAIVLEDDTLPEPSFFAFCEAMLDRYADDPGVVHVSGSNTVVGQGLLPAADAYRLNRLPDIWGWATWSRAWRHYDIGLSDWAQVSQTTWLAELVPHPAERRALQAAFQLQHERAEDPHTWDWSWIFTAIRCGQSVTPMQNLVTNIGFGSESTHCYAPDDTLAWLPSAPIDIARLTAPEGDPAEELDALLLAHRLGGARARRQASPFALFRSDKLVRRLRRIVYGPTGRPNPSGVKSV